MFSIFLVLNNETLTTTGARDKQCQFFSLELAGWLSGNLRVNARIVISFQLVIFRMFGIPEQLEYLGFFATVFFILYSIEHLKKYKASFLKKKSQKKVAYSGLIYLLLVGLVLISGVVLFFYDADYVVVWNPIHFYSSFFILITLFLHWITRK